MLGSVDKFDPISSWSQEEHAEECLGELVVSGSDGTVDLEVPEDALDAIALAVEAFTVSDRHLAIGFRWNDRFGAALLQIGPNGIGVVSFVGQNGHRLLFW